MYSWKGDEFGWPVKPKARLVARGDQQRYYIDLSDLYAPTVDVSSVRLLVAYACEMNLGLYHFDVDQAFVRADLSELVFMRLPQGCGVLSGKVVQLNKSLYGLRQASRQWFAMLKKILLRLGFEQCQADACVFRLIEGGKVAILLVFHVDDIFAVGEKEKCDQFGEDMNRLVPTKNLGELKWYSGCFYERDREAGRIKISQQTYVEELGRQYGVTSGGNVPLSGSLKLWDFGVDEPDTDQPFRELVGALLWVARQSRPDILNAVRAVARYCSSPKMIHWKAALGILGYTVGTSSYGISFQRGTLEGFALVAFCDADYASKAADRRSVSGGVVMCAGGAVIWISKTQRCVTMSTSEAEYVAMGDVVKELLFIRQVWGFMLPTAPTPCIPVYEDNQGAIQIAKHPISNSNSKHIDVRHHFLRERVEENEIDVIHVPSELQHADFLTKVLPEKEFTFHRDFVMNIG